MLFQGQLQDGSPVRLAAGRLDGFVVNNTRHHFFVNQVNKSVSKIADHKVRILYTITLGFALGDFTARFFGLHPRLGFAIGIDPIDARGVYVAFGIYFLTYDK